MAGAVVLALLVALLPRTDGTGTPAGPDLGPARAQAGLAACAAPEPGRAETGPLAGVSVTCLGDGKPVDVGTVLGPGPTLVNVWATWCQPCREELPLLQRYAAEPGAARVVTVQVASSQQDGLALLSELGVRLPTVYDGEGGTGPVRTALSVPRALPASYVVHPDGTATFVDNPRLFTSLEQIQDTVGRAR